MPQVNSECRHFLEDFQKELTELHNCNSLEHNILQQTIINCIAKIVVKRLCWRPRQTYLGVLGLTEFP